MDEATANIDLYTEKIIQDLIQEEFEDCTVIKIAHRLNTIVNSTKILVIENGKAVEFDTPENLTSNPDSTFSRFLKEFKN